MAEPEQKAADAEQLAKEMYEAVDRRTREYQGKSYTKVFVGSDGVDFLMSKGVSDSREGCVAFGNLMMKAQIFAHCMRDHPFRDSGLFYRFLKDEQKGKKLEKEEGHVYEWADFFQGKPLPKKELKLQAHQIVLDNDTYMVESLFDVAPLDDPYNQELLNNCHPPKWENPTNPPERYNVIVIGGGAGGLNCARSAAERGARVALIEKELTGGDCLVAGCVPSKALLKSARVIYEAGIKGKEYGITFDNFKIDFDVIMTRMRKLRAEISHDDAVEVFTKKLGIDIYIGKATFTGKDELEVGGQKLKFYKCVLGTGGTPTVPKVPGLDKVKFMTNLTFFNQTSLPRRLGVIGAGPIGSEMAQAMALFGSEVHIMNRSEHILGKEDPEAAAVVHKSMEKCGCKIYLHTKMEKVEYASEEKDENGDRPIKMTYSQGDEEFSIEVDRLLIAIGRKPNTTGYGLEFAGVDADPLQGVHVNDFLETSNPNIYAVGDCCTRYQFTHVAGQMGRIVCENALFGSQMRFSDFIIPWVTFTHPEVAHVGLYEDDCNKESIPFDTWKAMHKYNDRAICDGDTLGFTKILVKKGTDTILGATVCSDNAGDILNGITYAMNNNIGLEALGQTIHPYPTISKTIMGCGLQLMRAKLTPMTRDLFRKIVNLRHEASLSAPAKL